MVLMQQKYDTTTTKLVKTCQQLQTSFTMAILLFIRL